MRNAFKEWAVIVDALGKGEQILILRKGGISEGRGGFKMEHSRFWLFPTLFHQQRESVLPHAQARFDAFFSTLESGKTVPIEYFGEIASWRKLESITELEPLRGQHIWRDEVIQSRFEWGGEHAIFAIALRVWKLPQSIEIPVREDYGGCKSWIELQMPLDLQGAVPVLSDTAFASRLRRFHESLPAPARNHPPLILASQSPRRVDLLREIEPDFGVVASLAVELHDATVPPRRLCEINAQRKALAVAERFPAHLILGADTLVFLDGKPLGKPADIEEARWMLQQLSGRIHEVITGLCLIQHESNRILLFSEVSRVRFKSLTPPVIDEYLSRVFVFDKAGGYAIQEYGEWIVESVEGSYSNIVGLPQEALRAALSTWNRKANSQ